MKKLFISLPVIGRTKEAIEDSIYCMKNVAELMFDEKLELIDEELELINEYIKDITFKDVKQSAYYSAKFIEILSQSDYLIAIDPESNREQLLSDNWFILTYPIEKRYIETRDFKCFDDLSKLSNKKIYFDDLGRQFTFKPRGVRVLNEVKYTKDGLALRKVL